MSLLTGFLLAINYILLKIFRDLAESPPSSLDPVLKNLQPRTHRFQPPRLKSSLRPKGSASTPQKVNQQNTQGWYGNNPCPAWWFFTNPKLKTYANVKMGWTSSPRNRGEHQKYLSCHHLDVYIESCLFPIFWIHILKNYARTFLGGGVGSHWIQLLKHIWSRSSKVSVNPLQIAHIYSGVKKWLVH